MSKKSLSIHAASGADSTQAQEQAVKSFSSSMPLRTSMARPPSMWALTTNIIVALCEAFGLTLPPLPITMSFWQCAVTFTAMKRTPNLWRRTSPISPVNGTPRDL